MNILEKFTLMASSKVSNIGIGLGEDKSHNIKILDAASQILQNNKSTIYLIGDSASKEHLSKESILGENNSHLSIIDVEEPEREILKLLQERTIKGMVRGSMSSSKFLQEIKTNLKISEINRLAILETFNGHQFFYGPVGIDECNTIEKKKDFIKKSVEILASLKIKPNISILSGGRKGDLGRDPYVDETIKTAVEIVDYFKKEQSDLSISHEEILIENAVEKGSNLIIAPDGISGNLIYRTLVHLGGGKAHGAIYMGINDIIIDTSRVGNLDEIKGALLLAIALSP